MKRNKVGLLLLIFIGSIWNSACDHLGESPIKGPQYPESQIVLEINYVNFAWGASFQNIFITRDGKGHLLGASVAPSAGASAPQNWFEPDENGWIAGEALNANFLQADSVLQEIGAIDFSAIDNAILTLEEDVGEPVGRCFDFGTIKYWVYRWEETAEKYQRLFVQQCGDVAIQNEHEMATIIAEQLTEIELIWSGACCME
ncbi:MAG: hypothetical protein AAGD05_10370 [Bacteroidota bacterium]